MQRALSILIALVVVAALLGAAVFVFVLRPSPATGPTQTSGSSAPYGSNTTSVTGGQNTSTATTSAPRTMSLTIQSGKKIAVKDFIHNGETVADVVNPGYYVLAGSLGYCLADGSCPAGYKTDDFVISFHDTNGLFNITLIKEPLAQSRDEAGIFLIDRLGLTPAQVCGLNYWVGVPTAINAVYAGKNLGFSFCPGATTL